MNKKRYWLKFGIIFLISDIILSFALIFMILSGLYALSPLIIYPSLAINPYIVLGTFHINFLSSHFPLTPNGIYFWPIAWLIIGVLVGWIYGRIKK